MAKEFAQSPTRETRPVHPKGIRLCLLAYAAPISSQRNHRRRLCSSVTGIIRYTTSMSAFESALTRGGVTATFGVE